MKLSRRNFLSGSAVLASVAAISGRSQAAAIPEAPTTDSPLMRQPVAPRREQRVMRLQHRALAIEQVVEGGRRRIGARQSTLAAWIKDPTWS